jgi:sucrose-6-phosphate hydrolase SacC (GH32 family)
MPFNQQMTVPVSLTLRQSDGDYRLCAQPYGVASLHGDKTIPTDWKTQGASGSGIRDSIVLADNLDEFDLSMKIDPRNAQKITFDLRGTKLVYDAAKQTLTCKDVSAPIKLLIPEKDGRNKELNLRILLDRGSIEVFADGGLVAMSIAAIPDEKNHSVTCTVESGVVIRELSYYKMKSAWVSEKKK